jgi:F-type H+-transporting ATPase subunit delta
MAEIVTVARPYAEAAFRNALDKNALGPSAEQLELVAAIANDPQMRAALANPKVSPQQKKELFLAGAGDKLEEATRNLVSMLVDSHRESLFGSISEQFDALKRDHEKVLIARITSARALDDTQRAELVQALELKYGKKIEVELDVDPELLGGARVQIGDEVIHASVRDALAQMAAALSR